MINKQKELETRAGEKNIILLTLFLITVSMSILIIIFIFPMVRTNKRKKEEILGLFFFLKESEIKDICTDFENFNTKLNVNCEFF